MRLRYRARGFPFSILIAGGKWKDSLLIQIINSCSMRFSILQTAILWISMLSFEFYRYFLGE